MALGGCSGGGNNSGGANSTDGEVGSTGPRNGGRVVIGVQHEPEMLSEILNSTATNNMVCNLIFSKFVKYDDNLQLHPDLIESIPTRENGGISEDYLTYTYKIRADAQWHDGEPVTSDDVIFTYNTIMHPKVNVESREGWDVVASVTAIDEKTVQFRLKQPYPDFVSETFYEESVLPEHILKDTTGERFHSARFHHAPVGSGPFMFQQWVPGSHLVVSRNDNYYGDGPYLDQIIFKFIPNENTLLVQLRTGEIDVFDNANINFIDQLTSLPGVIVHKTPMLMYEHLDFNTEHPALRDKRVRMAIAHAINKEEIATKVYNGLVEVAQLDEFRASKYYNPDAAGLVDYNPKKAKMLLFRAGWKDGNGDGFVEKDGVPLKLTLTASAGQLNRERTELVIRDQLKDVGIDVEIRNFNATVLYGTYEDGGILKRGRFDIAMYAWLSSPEPATKEALYSANSIPPRGQNHPRIRNAQLTDLLAKGSNEIDPDRRVEIYHEVADILVDEMPVVPLFWYTSIDPAASKIRNFRPNPTQSADTWNANQWYLGEL